MRAPTSLHRDQDRLAPREGHMSVRDDATGVIRARGAQWFAYEI